MIKRLAAWIVMLDLLWNVVLNVKSALLPSATPAPRDGLPISPEFAFGWIQVLVNGSMALLVILSILLLFKMQRLGSHGNQLAFTIPRVSAMLVVLAFAVPSAWLWGWALLNTLQGNAHIISTSQLRYFVVALCQPFLVLLVWNVWRQQRRLRRRVVFAVQPENQAQPIAAVNNITRSEA